MPTSLLKNLYLSSLFILCVGCTVPRKYKLTGENVLRSSVLQEAVTNSQHGLKYKMSVQLFRNYFTGILLYKKTDSTTYHLAFVTELGLKMFEMEMKSSTFKTLYCFEPMNKPKIKTLLENQMNLLLLTDFNKVMAKEYTSVDGQKIFLSKNGTEKHIYCMNGNMVHKVRVKKGVSTKVKTTYFYAEPGDAPETVDLRHKGLIRLRIGLNKIKNE